MCIFFKVLIVYITLDIRKWGAGLEEIKLAEQLATEIMHELKKSSRRWFIAFCVMCIIEIGTICGFLWYVSLPVEESTKIEQDADDVSGDEFKQIIGDNYDD